MNQLRAESENSDKAHPGRMRLQAMPLELPAQQSLFAAPVAASSDEDGESAARVEMRRTDSIKPHPSLVKHKLWHTNEQLLALEKLGNTIFEQPLLITRSGLIVDGYARWRIARRKQRALLLCIVCTLTEQEALQRILQLQRRKAWLNYFCRVQLALENEPWYQEKARANMSAGGKRKGSSKLTEDRRLDTRKQVAADAGVCSGNVTKVKQILSSPRAIQLIEALRNNEIRIHRAWTFRELPVNELEAELGWRKFEKRRDKRLRILLARQIPKGHPDVVSIHRFNLALKGLRNAPFMATHWKEIDVLITAVEHGFSNRSVSDVRQENDQADPGR